MFFVVFSVRKRVRVTDTGTFFCLRCNADCGYELREWWGTPPLLFLAVLVSHDQFVLCTTCRTTFDPECLDESSTAELRELEIDVPEFARKALRARPAHELARYVGHDSLDHEQAHAQAPPQAQATWSTPEIQGQGRRTFSAHSAFRRH